MGPCSAASGSHKRYDYHRRYYLRNKDKLAAQKRAYRAQHLEKVAAYWRVYRSNNKERVAEYQRRYRAKHKHLLKLKRCGVDAGANLPLAGCRNFRLICGKSGNSLFFSLLAGKSRNPLGALGNPLFIQ